jgi:hypothetical protein
VLGWCERHLPIGPTGLQVTLSKIGYGVSPAVHRVIPWVVLVLHSRTLDFTIPLVRIPGATYAELWWDDDEGWDEA